MMLALGLFLGILAFGYLLTAYLAVQRARNDKVPQSPQRLAPVTVLKPLCGAEPGLEQALESLCGQCDSSVQIVFGVQDPADPALPIARALAARYPALDIAIVVDSSRHGHSAKVSNLINMMRVARHDYLVLADSDVHVPAGYLAGVCAPLADPTVGIVTCPYRGRPGRSSGAAGVCSELAALFINDWFMPSVRVASWLGSRAFAFGATIALRRAVLKDIGLYSGATVLGSGHLALILDPGAIAMKAGVTVGAEDAAAREVADETDGKAEAGAEYLLVEIGGRKAAVPLSGVLRIEQLPLSRIERIGCRPVVNFEGQLLPVEDAGGVLAAAEGSAEDTGGDEAQIVVVVCREGNHQIGVAVSHVLDVASGSALFEAGGSQRATGVTLLKNRVIGVVNLGGVAPSLAESAPEEWNRIAEGVR